MKRRYKVLITETITRQATVTVYVGDDEDNYVAERIAEERLASGKSRPRWTAPEKKTKLTGWRE